MSRHKPKYNSLRLKYIDSDSVEHTFYCDEVSSNVKVSMLINMPVKDSGSRFITDSDLDFKIDDYIMQGENKKRITEIPEITPHKNNNSRRGVYRKDKVLVTT